MKKLFLFAAVMFSVVLFSACTEDDNSACTEDNNKEGNQTSQKLLKQIEIISGSATWYYNFSYDDQQRLAKVIIDGDHDFCGDYLYTYTDNSVSIKYNDSYDPWNYDAVFTLDRNGYVTKLDINGKTRWQYEYKNGYVSSKSSDTHIETYRWENGNLMENRQSVSDIYISTPHTFTTTYTYTYTDKQNKLNVNLFDGELSNLFIDSGIFVYSSYGPFTYFKGSIASNYPASIISDSDYEFFTRDSWKLSYEYDDEGYPTGIVVSNDRGGFSYLRLTYY